MLRPTGTLVKPVAKKPLIQIDDNIPPPSPMGARRFGLVEAVHTTMQTMEVGQSFVLPISRKTYLSMAKTMYAKTKKQFASRTVVEDDQTIVRVWRVE